MLQNSCGDLANRQNAPSDRINVYIVACQRGGVSNKPPGLQTATRHGARDPLVRSQVDLTPSSVIATYKIF